MRYSGLYASSLRDKLDEARKNLSQGKLVKLEALKWQKYLEELSYNPKCKRCGLSLIHREKVTAEKTNISSITW